MDICTGGARNKEYQHEEIVFDARRCPLCDEIKQHLDEAAAFEKTIKNLAEEIKDLQREIAEQRKIF